MDWLAVVWMQERVPFAASRGIKDNQAAMKAMNSHRAITSFTGTPSDATHNACSTTSVMVDAIATDSDGCSCASEAHSTRQVPHMRLRGTVYLGALFTVF